MTKEKVKIDTIKFLVGGKEITEDIYVDRDWITRSK